MGASNRDSGAVVEREKWGKRHGDATGEWREHVRERGKGRGHEREEGTKA